MTCRVDPESFQRQSTGSTPPSSRCFGVFGDTVFDVVRRAVRALGLTGSLLVALVACSESDPKVRELARWSADAPVSPISAGPFAAYFAERLTGRIYRLAYDSSNASPELVATIEVDTSGEQRGLLGLAVVGDRIFASWVRPGDLRVVVGQVDGTTAQPTTWVGPVTDVKAIGGHLGVLDGRLVLGLGELVQDPSVAGKIVTLDPDGRTDQTPVDVSAGWHNPFGFIVEDGAVVVVDNAPDGEKERLGPVPLPESAERAPSAVVRIDKDRLGVCGFLDGQMRAYRTDGVTIERAGTIISSGCRTGAMSLGDGRYLVTDESAVALVGPGS